jgi:predicted amidohydrolase
MKITVAACQQPLHEPLSAATLKLLQEKQTDFVCLPEHYPLRKEIGSLTEAAADYDTRKQYLSGVSSAIQSVVVGGTITETASSGYYNTCYVFEEGKEVGFYRKINPTSREMAAGVLRGDEFKMFSIRGLRVGVLICADVLDMRSFEELASLECQVAFIPTASPLRSGESVEEKFKRDRAIFLEGARKMRCPLVKTCGVGTTFGHPIQGRSLIATPDRIIARAEPDQEDQQLILFAELTI